MGLLSALVNLPGNVIKNVVDDVSGKNDTPLQGASICSFGISSILRGIKKNVRRRIIKLRVGTLKRCACGILEYVMPESGANRLLDPNMRAG